MRGTKSKLSDVKDGKFKSMMFITSLSNPVN
jgi:hypothetical protein